MNREKAIEIALRELNATYDDPDDDLVALENEVTDRPYGWIIFYQSRTYVETGDATFMLAGNGPCVVMKDGEIHMLGTAKPIDEEIAQFEQQNGLSSL